jgi:hypothetical protein
MAKKLPKFVLVKSTSPRQPDGLFRRAELAFTREWRALEVLDPDAVDPETKTPLAESIARAIPLISVARLARLEAETMLAVRPATDKELEQAQLDAAEAASKDPATRIADLQAKNADLEARLMRLELGAGGKGGGGGGGRGGEAPKG